MGKYCKVNSNCWPVILDTHILIEHSLGCSVDQAISIIEHYTVESLKFMVAQFQGTPHP